MTKDLIQWCNSLEELYVLKQPVGKATSSTTTSSTKSTTCATQPEGQATTSPPPPSSATQPAVGELCQLYVTALVM